MFEKIILSKSKIEENYKNNSLLNLNDFPEALNKDGYIIDQSKLSKYKYGNYTSDYNGCGWVAAYNCFKSLNIEKKPAEIINFFEKDGAILGGTFGTSPKSVEKIFQKENLNIQKTSRISNMSSQASNNITNILIYGGLNSNNKWFAHYTSFVKSNIKDKFMFYNRIYGDENDIQDLKDVFKGTFLVMKICVSIGK